MSAFEQDGPRSARVQFARRRAHRYPIAHGLRQQQLGFG